MRIDSLQIDGFGVFSDVHLESLSPRLTVFCGPNESGKSTLLSFVRFMLFGFPDKRTKTNRYPPLHAGAAHGGTMLLCAASGRYRLERHDTLRLVFLDGPPETGADLGKLLGGVTRETFNSIFAFSLHELQQLDDAFDQGAAREALYGASAGVDHQRLSSAEQDLEEGLSRLFKPRSKKAVINAALAEVDDLQQQIRKLENDLAAFDKLQAEIGSLELAARDALERRREINAGLECLKDFEACLERRGKLNSQMARLQSQAEELRRSRSEICLDEALLRLAGDIRNLLKSRDYALDLRRRKIDAQQVLENLRQELAAGLAALPPEWALDRLRNFRVPVGLADEIAVHETALRQAELLVAEARATERAAEEDQKSALEEEKQAAAAFEGAVAPPQAPDPVLFEQLQSGRGDYERATRDLRAREGELRAKEDEFRHFLSEIDPRWTEEDLQRFDTSLAARQEIERFRERHAEAVKVWERARDQVAHAETEAKRTDERRRDLQAQYDANPRLPCDDPVVLAEYREIHHRLALRWASESQGPFSRRLALVTAFAGVLAGLALSFHLPRAGAFIAVLSLVVAFWLWRLARARAMAREKLQAEFASLCERLSLSCILSDEAMLQAGRAIDAAGEALAQRQSILAQLRQAGKEETEARELLSHSRQALREAEETTERQMNDWRRHLERVGLPSSLLPEGALAIISRIELGRAHLESVRTLRHRIQAMERNRQEYLGVFNSLLAARGQPSASHVDLSVRLSQFLETVRKENELRQQKENARERWMRAVESRRQAEDALLNASRKHRQAAEREQETAAAWREWLARNSLPSRMTPSAVRDLLQAISRARGLLDRIDNTEEELRGIVNGETTFAGYVKNILASAGRPASTDSVADLDSLAAALQSADEDARQAEVLDVRIVDMDRRLAEIRGELEETEQHIARLHPPATDSDLDAYRRKLAESLSKLDEEVEQIQARLVECRDRRKAMATDEHLSRLYEQKQARLEEISQAVREWAVLALARHMFEQARKRYEEQRQPAVVRRASTHFRHLTRDRYRDVRMPLDGSDLHVITAGDAAPKTVGQLSRGTAEQLYLALRFGFIQEFARNRDPLPIIMDDILVNFDPSRATAAVETLVQLSEGFQVFYFTCHPNAADKFQEIDSSVPVLRLFDGGVSV
jgi:uncharacterized protein YhaN